MHDLLKNELGTSVLRSKRFGADVAWFRLAVITHNVLTGLKRLALLPELLKGRPKRLRFLIFTTPGRLIEQAALDNSPSDRIISPVASSPADTPNPQPILRKAEPVDFDLPPEKTWRRWLPAWIRALIWVDASPRYDAFLSYSWTSDSKVAPIIQSVLQRFLCPWYRLRAKTIFRDLSCLPAGSSLEAELFDRLDRSEHLLVLASPEAAQSQGMELEARHWFSRKRQGQVLVIITSGNCETWLDVRKHLLAPSLRDNLPDVPLWIDLHDKRSRILGDAKDARFRGELIEDLKQILLRFYPGRDWGQLRGEERAQRRRAILLISGLSLLFLVLTATALGAANYAREELQVALARKLASDSALVHSRTLDDTLPVLLGIESTRRSDTVEGFEALSSATNRMSRQIANLRHEGEVWRVRFSPSGSFLATSSFDKTARVFDVHTGREVSRLVHQGAVHPLTFSPDGSLVATGASDGTARIFEARTGKEKARIQDHGEVWSVAFNRAGDLIATGDDDSTTLFDVRKNQQIARFVHGGKVTSVAFSPDGSLLATASWDKFAHIFDVKSREEITKLPHEGLVHDVVFSPDGTLVATASQDNSARIFEARTRKQIHQLKHDRAVTAITFSSHGELLATASEDMTARIFDARTGQELARLLHEGVVYSIAFSPDGTLLATGSDDNTARVFVARTGLEITRMPHPKRVQAVTFSPDGRMLATASEDNIARIFETRNNRDIATITPGSNVLELAFSSDGKLLGTSLEDSSARLIAADTGQELMHRANAFANVWAFSSNGRFVVTGGTSKEGRSEARVVEISTHRESVLTEKSFAGLSALALSSDGRLVAIGLSGGSVPYSTRVYPKATGQVLTSFSETGPVNAVIFSDDSKLVAIGSENSYVEVSEVDTGRQLWRAAEPQRIVAVAFAPDGSYVVAGCGDYTARIINSHTGHELLRLLHQGVVNAVAVSPDSRFVATGSDDRTARLFNANTGQELARLDLDAPVRGLAFVAGGKMLKAVVVGSNSDIKKNLSFIGGSIRVPEQYVHITQHLIRTDDLVTDSCSKLLRLLSTEEWHTYIGITTPRPTCDNLGQFANRRPERFIGVPAAPFR